MFSAAYAGELTVNDMTEFRQRIEERSAIVRDPSLSFWTPAFGLILDWVEKTVSAGGTVFEIGCGLGYVLHSLRRRGYRAVGLDVAEVPVLLNRSDGFPVWQGTVNTVPDGWVQPSAIVIFFVMHHLPDPMAFLATIRAKWPDTPVAIAQYGPTNKGTPASLPPRTQVRWSAQGLKTALERSGYQTNSFSLASSGTERALLRPVKWLLRPTMSVPVLRRFERRIQRHVLPAVFGRLGREDYVVVAIGIPGAIAVTAANVAS